jgi:RNA polymerase sigma-70 factor (ECF subfamily)
VDLDVHLAGIVAGDDSAFARWSLRSFASAVDAEAVLQEALLRIWQVAPRHKPDGRPNSLLRLCARVARNIAMDELRRASRVELADDGGLELAMARIDAAMARAEERDPLLRALIEECHGKLPNKPSEALAARLSSHGGEPDETLAQRLGMKLNTFLQNFTRARKLLAECLRGKGVDLEAELR